MLESGAIYRNVPAHALAFELHPSDLGCWTPEEAQAWDCYGERFTCLEYRYLSGLECSVKTASGKWDGTYLFTAAPIGDGYSAYPDQAKEFCFIQLHLGRLTIQPTNHVVFRERSFTDNRLEHPSGLKRQSEIWSCE
jgi:hypothetical protein